MIKITLRLPDDIHESISKLADEENRSLNAEIVRAIKRHLLVAHAKAINARIESGEEKAVSHEELMQAIEEKRARLARLEKYDKDFSETRDRLEDEQGKT